ncbi:MAG: lysine biosynthesis protein LysW [Candidatus Bathyarchaeia archaeon]|jgi:hypothetical protein
MSERCPECGFDFSSKPDFLRYAEPGEIIQCPDCGTELEVGKDRSLSVVELEDLDWGESDRGSK